MRPSRREFVKRITASGIALSLSRLAVAQERDFAALPGRQKWNPPRTAAAASTASPRSPAPSSTPRTTARTTCRAGRPRRGYRPCRTATIWYIVTEPAQRRRGIARTLMGAAAEWAEQKEASRIELSVWSFNDDARALYRKLGFAESHVHMTIKPSDALATCGSGHLPRMRLPKWMTPWRSTRAAPPPA